MPVSPSLGDARSQLGYRCDHQISPLKRDIFSLCWECNCRVMTFTSGDYPVPQEPFGQGFGVRQGPFQSGRAVSPSPQQCVSSGGPTFLPAHAFVSIFILIVLTDAW